MQGKIIKGIAGFYYVHTSEGIIYECKAKGAFRNQKIKPLVGDNVEIAIVDEEHQKGNIVEIMKRKNALIRPAVANVDQALVLFAAMDPEPNLNLLDRFLIMMERQHVTTHICFNKADLVDEDKIEKLSRLYKSCGYKVFITSTYEKHGIDDILNLLKNKTTVLAGPSGVGKSSLVNIIKPEANMETGGISEKIRRGKHTTRHSEFFAISERSYILDTPGFSSIYVEDMEPEDLKLYFPEFEPFEEGCKFTGCVHIGEKVCGIKKAYEEGTIPSSRYENYTLLYNELKDKRRY